ncbi:hypothetical protein MBLNU459_g2529t2 [Dothideomycetes sp. NU459]
MRPELGEGRIVPARLSWLAIYNPSLSTTDDTFRDQVVFYYHHRAAAQARARNKAQDGANEARESKEQENEKLRQIGLAQGMVDFARSFSDGKAVHSVETEKSRIVMHELETGWWVLASIDLTRMPAMHPSSPKTQDVESAPQTEYSSREVSPPPLLLQQLITANRTFLLHHAQSLSDLFVKLPRDRFCSVLDRFWMRFCRTWDVLLHGNPSIDVFGGLKLAAGGELGFGVGEEEWGSGEREVLEGLVYETEGLVDLTVSRFGEVAAAEDDGAADHLPDASLRESQAALPWLGRGHFPQAPDGVIFSGTGAVARSSIRDVSAWVQQIYTYGERAYGVRDAPHRARRKMRRQQSAVLDHGDTDKMDPDTSHLRRKAHQQSAMARAPAEEKVADEFDELKSLLPHDPRPAMHDRVASHDHATDTPTPQVASHPAIPPPIVAAAEHSLNQALSAMDATPKPPADTDQPEATTYGISNRWMKYLTLGLSEIGKPGPGPPARPSGSRRTSSASSRTIKAVPPHGKDRLPKDSDIQEDDAETPLMQNLDPTPDGYKVASQIARQRSQENKGHFIVGLQGDLDCVPMDGELADLTSSESEGARNVLRTLHVEIPRRPSSAEEDSEATSLASRTSVSIAEARAPKHKRLRVLVYIHRPFIYTFLFEPPTPTLKMTSFYRNLHLHLRPLHKSLLSSTSAYQVASRIAASHSSPSQPSSIDTTAPPYNESHNSPVFDLVYDPLTFTLHTSLPNIPEPGTLAAEGIGAMTGKTSTGRVDPPPWTRIEALNVHSQILNTLMSVRDEKRELERTSKTSRGWWVVWMRIPPSTAHPSMPANDAEINQPQTNPLEREDRRVEDCIIAFLVRKSSDAVRSGAAGRNVSSRVTSAMFAFAGAATEDQQPGQPGWSAGNLAGGIGIDARRYVEGLLSLNR